MENLKYGVDYFITKFEQDNNWCVTLLRDDKGNSCALGKVSLEAMDTRILSKNIEAQDLISIFDFWWKKEYNLSIKTEANPFKPVYYINDDLRLKSNLGDTPKERILGVLYQVKKIQEQEQIDNIDISEITEVLEQELVNI